MKKGLLVKALYKTLLTFSNDTNTEYCALLSDPSYYLVDEIRYAYNMIYDIIDERVEGKTEFELMLDNHRYHQIISSMIGVFNGHPPKLEGIITPFITSDTISLFDILGGGKC